MVFLILLGVVIIVCPLLMVVLLKTGIIKSDSKSESFCPHGYEDFGCQPCCPLYEHCWGKRE